MKINYDLSERNAIELCKGLNNVLNYCSGCLSDDEFDALSDFRDWIHIQLYGEYPE